MKGRALLDTEQLRATIRTVPDFPKPGIQFRDITTMLADPAALHSSVALLADHARTGGRNHVFVERSQFSLVHNLLSLLFELLHLGLKLFLEEIGPI